MALPDADNQTKPKGVHLEVTPNETSESKHGDNGIVDVAKSKFDDLSVGQTLWTFRRVVLVSLAVYTGFVCEGFELKIGNNILANKGFIKQFGSRGGQGVEALDPTWVSTWTSLLNVGQIITFLYIPWYSDRFGRKACFYLSWLWLAVGCVFLNVAKTPAVWALGKLCNGAGVGILQVTCQIYVMEICPNKIRGGMITFQAVWSNIGNITCNVMMQELNRRWPLNYTLPLRILIAPVVLMMFFWAFVPESPWHHTRRGNKEKAMKSLRQLYGGVEGYDFEQEYDIIAKTIQHEREFMAEEPGFLHVFKGVNLKRTLTVMLLSVCSQFGGLSVVLSYSTYFFDLAGVSDPFLGTLILSVADVRMLTSPSCCNLLAVFLWSMTTDTFGRRNFINVCETATCCFLFITGSLWWAGATSGNVPASNALHSYATPRMLLALNIKACFIFGALSVPCCILMWLYVPETKGRSTAEIDELYERRIPAWKWSKTRTSVEDHSLTLLTEKE
ncbi:unnamed protein product [Clonostachys byssicola]|uniref:Major facilitator superfamily (MFS) profile domain-containing protein n=1 Tax=Clonostachys byssicola TaxID=160290 RepID=A0A9N9UYX8_9HYPO|nr:unnamed protein product [Clonostachys byssicola]